MLSGAADSTGGGDSLHRNARDREQMCCLSPSSETYWRGVHITAMACSKKAAEAMVDEE